MWTLALCCKPGSWPRGVGLAPWTDQHSGKNADEAWPQAFESFGAHKAHKRQGRKRGMLSLGKTSTSLAFPVVLEFPLTRASHEFSAEKCSMSSGLLERASFSSRWRLHANTLARKCSGTALRSRHGHTSEVHWSFLFGSRKHSSYSSIGTPWATPLRPSALH